MTSSKKPLVRCLFSSETLKGLSHCTVPNRTAYKFIIKKASVRTFFLLYKILFPNLKLLRINAKERRGKVDSLAGEKLSAEKCQRLTSTLVTSYSTRQKMVWAFLYPPPPPPPPPFTQGILCFSTSSLQFQFYMYVLNTFTIILGQI